MDPTRPGRKRPDAVDGASKPPVQTADGGDRVTSPASQDAASFAQRDGFEASAPIPIPARTLPYPRLSIPEPRARRDSAVSPSTSSPGSFSPRSILSWISPTFTTIVGDFPEHIESAAKRLLITDHSTFDTDRDDTPSQTPLYDVGRAKVFLLGLYATAENEAHWDGLIELAEKIQTVQPNPRSVAVVARAVLTATHKPDGPDTLILLQGLTNLTVTSREALGGAGLALFSVLNPRHRAAARSTAHADCPQRSRGVLSQPLAVRTCSQRAQPPRERIAAQD